MDWLDTSEVDSLLVFAQGRVLWRMCVCVLGAEDVVGPIRIPQVLDGKPLQVNK